MHYSAVNQRVLINELALWSGGKKMKKVCLGYFDLRF